MSLMHINSAELVSESALRISTTSDGDVLVHGVCGRGYRMKFDEAVKFSAKLRAKIKAYVDSDDAQKLKGTI